MQLIRKFYDAAIDLGGGQKSSNTYVSQQLTAKDIENGLQLCSEPRPSDYTAMAEEKYFSNQMVIKDARNTVTKGPF